MLQVAAYFNCQPHFPHFFKKTGLEKKKTGLFFFFTSFTIIMDASGSRFLFTLNLNCSVVTDRAENKSFQQETNYLRLSSRYTAKNEWQSTNPKTRGYISLWCSWWAGYCWSCCCEPSRQRGSLLLSQQVFSPTSHPGIRPPPHSTRHRLPANANPQRTAMLATYFILLVSDAGMLVLGL